MCIYVKSTCFFQIHTKRVRFTACNHEQIFLRYCMRTMPKCWLTHMLLDWWVAVTVIQQLSCDKTTASTPTFTSIFMDIAQEMTLYFPMPPTFCSSQLTGVVSKKQPIYTFHSHSVICFLGTMCILCRSWFQTEPSIWQAAGRAGDERESLSQPLSFQSGQISRP